jgi:hypothetical protein
MAFAEGRRHHRYSIPTFCLKSHHECIHDPSSVCLCGGERHEENILLFGVYHSVSFGSICQASI